MSQDPRKPAHKSLLHRSFADGNGRIVVVLHDRLDKLQDAVALGAMMHPDRPRLAVQSARTQMHGGFGMTLGHFWYLGPLDRPELSTFGDGLYQLELLLMALYRKNAGGKVDILGTGEGGVMALVAGLLRADLVHTVELIDTPFPENFGRMPLQLPAAADLRAVLIDQKRSFAERTAQGLSAFVATASIDVVGDHANGLSALR